MKLTVNDLYVMNPPDGSQPLNDAYEAGLPFKVSMTIKRLMDSVTRELGVIDPERMKLVKEYGKPNKDKEGLYDMPKPGSKKFKEWNEKIVELSNTLVEVTYTPIDLDKLADDIGDKIIKGAFISVIDQLNAIHKRQEEEASKPKEEPVEIAQ